MSFKAPKGLYVPLVTPFNEDESINFESYKKGVEIIYTNLMDTFKKLGVEAFGEEGEEFDPNFHNAVMQVESEEYESGIVAQEFMKGYMYKDSVVRHSMVGVVS